MTYGNPPRLYSSRPSGFLLRLGPVVKMTLRTGDENGTRHVER